MRTSARDAIGKIYVGRDCVIRSLTRAFDPPDVTLINLNLMLADIGGWREKQNYVPLGLLYIAACLERAGFNVDFVDYQQFSAAAEFDPVRFATATGCVAPVIGFSCMSNLLPFAVACASEFKNRHPASRILLGGVGPSPVAAEIVSAFPFIDTVIEGEGELPTLDIMSGCAARLPARNAVRDLDSLPLPAYSLLDFGLYDACPSIITSRGCPYRCAFCTEPGNFGGGARLRSVDSVIEEIEVVHAASKRSLFLFQDDILPLARDRFQQLLRAFREDLSFPMRWKCFSRVDLMDEELMREMAASGCVQVRYGIESGADSVLERIRKGFTIEQAYRVVALSAKHFPSVHASFIWGYPVESMLEFEQTLDALRLFEEAGATVLLFQFSPLPGSPLYRELRNTGSLRFAPESFPSFVLTGHEQVGPQRYSLAESHRNLFNLVRDHAEIFPGFYEFENARVAAKRERLSPFAATVRTRNEYDL